MEHRLTKQWKIKTSERVAYEVADMLHRIGVKTLSDYKEKPIKTTLRGSWYVRKLLERGHTDCVHIDLDNLCGFIVVTEDGHIMSGSNIMVADAFGCIAQDYGLPIEPIYDMWVRWDGFEDSIIVSDLHQFLRFLAPALNKQ